MQSDLRNVLTHYGLLLLVIVGTMRLFISHGLSNWLPTTLETRGMTPVLAGTLTSLFLLIRIVGIVNISAVSDRFATRCLPIIASGVAGTVGVLGLTVGTNIWTLSVSLILVGVFVIGGLAPLIRVIPIEMDGIGPGLATVVTGLIFTVDEVGEFFGPFFIGFVYDHTGTFEPALSILALASLVTALAGYYIDEPSQSRHSGPFGEPSGE